MRPDIQTIGHLPNRTSLHRKLVSRIAAELIAKKACPHVGFFALNLGIKRLQNERQLRRHAVFQPHRRPGTVAPVASLGIANIKRQALAFHGYGHPCERRDIGF